jgi:tRNA threonylcarbamoyladenosine biosynthesis protein TsaE
VTDIFFSKILENETQTILLAREISTFLEKGDVLALYGNLGVGKSTFARALIQNLTSETQEVPSPTFTIVQVYNSKKADLWHFDFYRLQDSSDALELNIEEAFFEGISLIEWPERIADLLPSHHLKINISEVSNTLYRKITLQGSSGWIKRLAALKK